MEWRVWLNSLWLPGVHCGPPILGSLTGSEDGVPTNRSGQPDKWHGSVEQQPWKPLLWQT